MTPEATPNRVFQLLLKGLPVSGCKNGGSIRFPDYVRYSPVQTKGETRVSLRILAIAISLNGLLSSPAVAAFDYRTLRTVEATLDEFLVTLPGGKQITPPRVFPYEGKAYTPCGTVDMPAYCPTDNTVYLELELLKKANNHLGDYAAYVVLAHEYGHSYLMQLNRHPEGKAGELAADEFAGVFTRYIREKQLLDPGDTDEAAQLMYAVGDYDYGDTGHHGTPAERKQAFLVGLNGQSVAFGSSSPPSEAETDNSFNTPPSAPSGQESTEPESPRSTSPEPERPQAVESRPRLPLPLLLLIPGVLLAVVLLVQLLKNDED